MFWKRPKQIDQIEALRLLAKQLHEVGLRLEKLEERHDALKAAHDALRGRFYATRGEGSGPPPTSKGAILREFGYVPGQPAPHK